MRLRERISPLPLLLLLVTPLAIAQTPRDLFAAPPTGCPQSPIAAPPGPITAGDSVTLRRTTCLGSCPAYTLRIQGNGNVTWTGRRPRKPAGADRA